MKTHNTSLTMVVFGAVLAAVWALGAGGALRMARAGEHPTEHPSEGTEGAAKSHTEHTLDLKKEFTTAVEGYVKKTLAEKGTLPVRDVQGKDVSLPGELKLVKIHKDRIVRYKDDTYFACSDFIEKEGNKETGIDLDFFMTKKGDEWTTDRILLHKVNGKPMLTYVNNEPTPVK